MHADLTQLGSGRLVGREDLLHLRSSAATTRWPPDENPHRATLSSLKIVRLNLSH